MPDSRPKKFAHRGKLRGKPKRLIMFRKSPHIRRWLLRNPWIRPITVFNYAATRIQSWVRRFIILRRIRRTGKPFPPKRLRKKIGKPRQLDRYLAYLDINRNKPNKPLWLSAGFSSWCAVRIQATYRMYRLKRRFLLRDHLVNQVAAIVMQTFWKNCRYQILEHIASQSLHGEDPQIQRHNSGNKPMTPKRAALRALQREDHAVFRIQKCWRGFCNRRIYRYFRDLIVERLSAAPIELLRSIIPNEAAAFDRAAGTHVRFRLGGWMFPPKVFYKIYTHRPLCDVGSFAPRDYTEEKIEVATFTNTKVPSLQGYKTGRIKVGTRFFDAVVTTTNPSGTKKWYRREENNGWRPIASQMFAAVRPPPWFQPETTRERTKHFHFNSQYRKELREKQRLKIKKRWMRKFFQMTLQEQANAESNNAAPETTVLRSSSAKMLPRSSSPNTEKEYHSRHQPASSLELFPSVTSTSASSLQQLLQEREAISSRGNSGKVRHGAGHSRRGPPIRLPGYLRKDGDGDGEQPVPAAKADIFIADAGADLLNWSRSLDYDEYAKEWAFVGCSRPSEYHFAQQPALILGANK